MLRFFSWVAVFAVIYAIIQIILMDEEKVEKKRDEVAGVEQVKKTAPKESGQPEPFGAIPYAKRSRVYLFTTREADEEVKSRITGVLSSEHWQFLAKHQVIFQEVALPKDLSEASPRLRGLVEKHGVKSLPTLVVVSSEGRELGRRSEVDPNPKSLVNWIRDLADIKFRPFTYAKTGEQISTNR